MIKNYQKVVELLTANVHDLKSLAVRSGRPIFSFYNGADLIGINLDGQDLTGLNFDRADLRFASLNNIRYDPGCFNLSILDDKLSSYKDDYIFNIDDIGKFPSRDLLLFVQFRPKLVDLMSRIVARSYRSFADTASISAASLRKARYGQTVSIETAQAIVEQYKNDASRLEASGLSLLSVVDQPCASFLIGGNNAPFTPIDRDALQRLLLIRELRIRYHSTVFPNHSEESLSYRDTAEYLRNYEFLLDHADEQRAAPEYLNPPVL